MWPRHHDLAGAAGDEVAQLNPVVELLVQGAGEAGGQVDGAQSPSPAGAALGQRGEPVDDVEIGGDRGPGRAL